MLQWSFPSDFTVLFINEDHIPLVRLEGIRVFDKFVVP
jgi:hypothetical protein